MIKPSEEATLDFFRGLEALLKGMYYMAVFCYFMFWVAITAGICFIVWLIYFLLQYYGVF